MKNRIVFINYLIWDPVNVNFKYKYDLFSKYYEVIMFSLGNPQIYQADNVIFYSFPWSKHKSAIVRQISYLFFCLHKVVVNRPVSFVVSYDPALCGLIGLAIKKMTGSKLIIEVNSDQLFFSKINQHSWKKQFAGQIRLFIIKKNFNSADRIKFVSQALYDQYSRYLNLKPHAFKTKVFCNYYSTHHMRKSDNHDNFILVIGHPYYIKGIDILIRAFNQISADYPGIRLKVIGHCEDLSPYHKLVAEHSTVEFQKGVPFDQIISELEKCMFFVLPSRTEGLPRVVVEAMASGKAVIGSRVGGIPEVVEENKTGLLFESENYQELAKKMRLFLDDEEFMHRMGKAGHERARIHFSPERYVHRYHEFLRDRHDEQ